jgi:hypothetical protein
VGRFEANYPLAQNDCTLANPEHKIGCHDVASIIASERQVSFLMNNALVGFKNSGVCPFSRNVFSVKD